MSRQSIESRLKDQPAKDPEKHAKRIRMAVIAAIVALAAVFVVILWTTIKDDEVRERWDIFEALREEHEPTTDPLWRNPFGVYNPERLKFIHALEKFLDQKAEEKDDALAPHTRYVIAKTIADHILSNPGLLDQEKRAKLYADAAAHLEKIRDEYPDFPLNWSVLSEEGFPSLTRQFIHWLEANREWETENMLRSAEPDAGVRVLIRTDRGDMLLGLYRKGAPNWTTAFIERATNGFYDGTFFTKKVEIGDVAEPEVHTLLAGGPSTRDLKPFDVKAALKVAGVKHRSGLMPEEIRNRVPLERGIVCAWHKEGDTYDHESRFLVLARRSPRMDYDYTPIGKLVEENGIESLLTVDRIFGGDVWQKDAKVREDSENKDVLDYLQVPVRIEKVLVYENGVLRQPGEGALPSKAKATGTEAKLSTLKADAYKKDAPARPTEAPPPDKKDSGGEEAPLPPLEGSGDK